MRCKVRFNSHEVKLGKTQECRILKIVSFSSFSDFYEFANI